MTSVNTYLYLVGKSENININKDMHVITPLLRDGSVNELHLFNG